MFEKTRLQLTAWYLAIIMIVSFLFSLFIYAGVEQEFQRFEHVQQHLRERQAQLMPSPLDGNVVFRREELDPSLVPNARLRFISILGFINLAILGFSGAAGYFLAGRTLRPIKEMVDEQNRFITDSSHELRTPLTSLRSEIEVNLRNKKLSLSDAKKLLESNLEEVLSLQTLSDSLLELSQKGKPGNKSLYTSFKIAECISYAQKKLQGLLKKKGIDIQATGENTEVFGQKDRICELFVILLDNAIKYSPPKTTIMITAKKSQDSVSLSVADKGMGIEKEDIAHIFDRFYRASKSRSKKEASGYGLGLSIAKNIVTDHNGSISVASILDKGTTFTVKLPMSS